MKVRVCPKCDKHNLENAFNCIACGETLSIKTILDLETGEMNIEPIAGEKALGRISTEFEEQVSEILNPVREYGYKVQWGCNLTNRDKRINGFLILTSAQMIFVYFFPWEDNRLADASININLPFLPYEIAEVTMTTSMLTNAIVEIGTGLSKRYKKKGNQKYSYENFERRVYVRNLDDLCTVKFVKRWEGDEENPETILNPKIKLKFAPNEEMELYFLLEKDAHYACKILETYIRTGKFHEVDS